MSAPNRHTDPYRDLSEPVHALIQAYQLGCFPMADSANGDIGWYRPPTRAIFELPPMGVMRSPPKRSMWFHTPRSLRKAIRRTPFTLTTDQVFEQVMRECAAPMPGREDTWISKQMIALYSLAHEEGIAHSVEAWLEHDDAGRTLVGGIYGLAIGGAFFAESMFSRPELGGTDASRICLAALVDHLVASGFTLLDIQFVNTHLQQFNCAEVPLDAFLQRFEVAQRVQPEWLPFEPFNSRG